ncbi:conserved protein of unknown function [Limnospira indica PCC 8005]|uniref:Uncharacterized protein n=1 Tax=Limnospira indica PCC 8005 TaxID=376219 RepID=A0A9P1P159_9CYAN|nr:conserved protein of unknown function [Limnospira indica PCC 8005]
MENPCPECGVQPYQFPRQGTETLVYDPNDDQDGHVPDVQPYQFPRQGTET